MTAVPIPLLGLEPLQRAPPNKLPSEADVIRLLWGQVASNFRGFRGITSICCRVKDRRGVCQLGEQESCGLQNLPCLLFKVKERWLDAGFPVMDSDQQIMFKLTALKEKFDKLKKKFMQKRMKNEEQLNLNQELASTTFSLAPTNGKQRILADRFLTSSTNKERIRVLLDYIGDEVTRPTRFDNFALRTL